MDWRINQRMSTHRKFDLTTGSIPRHLVRMTIPMVWGILAIISFQLVDAYYIAQLGTTQLAAISFTFPVTYGVFSIFIGFGIATSSVVSRMIGEKRTEDMKRVASHSLLIVFLASLIIACIGIPLLHPLFTAMGASEEEYAMIKSFMLPYFIGTFFVSMPVVGNATLRASGDAVLPAIIMTIAALGNALINPVLIFGLWGFPRLELMGAAIGTIGANFMAMAAGIYVMHKRGLIDIAHIINLSLFRDSLRRLLMIALPAGITSMLPSFMGATVNHLLAKTGSEAVAAFGAASRMEAFLLVILMALSIGMAPIIGQNWGAGNIARVRETVKYAIGFSVVWSLVTAIIIMIAAGGLATHFSDDVSVQEYIILYMMIIPPSYFLGNIANGWGSTLNAIGKPQISAMMLFIKIVILTIPAIILGHHLAGVKGVFGAIAIINVVTGLVYHFWAWNSLGTKWVPKHRV